ncbi:hypothetical protein EMIHUDRAFT_468351 [Emiliania huxleyi CCMP1516]|uniref:Uncharacterized protein n=2 Tax=Emiliania huxleyi TaxID=2903 RepID=A0A0D3K459_EMIH1|nr:hypothetical protein EMIHUDRAFT_468351 [Emiliania huxleyi CCMP1516]EOD30544.1 hypothetical protein EMIHUDRAFT_468351 [Emiliania huxleyi CCMP1516]|eukprot:XP_005782973.1 hypothetical protein EMIHUDRAFT_468351 [Emiliania huxleyi CCMP1516]
MPPTSSRRSLGGLDAQNCRARRADAGLLLRRSKRELDLRRRRSGSGGPSSLLEDPRALEGEEASPRWDEMGVAEQVAQCAIRTIDYVRHGRHEERVSGGVAATERCVGCVRRLRRLLTAPEEAPIDAVIQAGLVPALVELLALPPPECSSHARRSTSSRRMPSPASPPARPARSVPPSSRACCRGSSSCSAAAPACSTSTTSTSSTSTSSSTTSTTSSTTTSSSTGGARRTRFGASRTWLLRARSTAMPSSEAAPCRSWRGWRRCCSPGAARAAMAATAPRLASSG